MQKEFHSFFTPNYAFLVHSGLVYKFVMGLQFSASVLQPAPYSNMLQGIIELHINETILFIGFNSRAKRENNGTKKDLVLMGYFYS